MGHETRSIPASPRAAWSLLVAAGAGKAGAPRAAQSNSIRSFSARSFRSRFPGAHHDPSTTRSSPVGSASILAVAQYAANLEGNRTEIECLVKDMLNMKPAQLAKDTTTLRKICKLCGIVTNNPAITLQANFSSDRSDLLGGYNPETRIVMLDLLPHVRDLREAPVSGNLRDLRPQELATITNKLVGTLLHEVGVHANQDQDLLMQATEPGRLREGRGQLAAIEFFAHMTDILFNCELLQLIERRSGTEEYKQERGEAVKDAVVSARVLAAYVIRALNQSIGSTESMVRGFKVESESIRNAPQAAEAFSKLKEAADRTGTCVGELVGNLMNDANMSRVLGSNTELSKWRNTALALVALSRTRLAVEAATPKEPKNPSNYWVSPR